AQSLKNAVAVAGKLSLHKLATDFSRSQGSRRSAVLSIPSNLLDKILAIADCADAPSAADSERLRRRHTPRQRRVPARWNPDADARPCAGLARKSALDSAGLSRWTPLR